MPCRPSAPAPGQFTANTMAMVSEAMGLTMPHVVDGAGRLCRARAIARKAGRLVMEILERGGPLPREIVTRKSLENASAIVAATGGSTNAALHLPAIANEAGITFTLDDVGAVFDAHAADRQSAAGRQIYRQGRLRYRRRAGGAAGAGRKAAHLHGACPTVTGRTLAEEMASAPDRPTARSSGRSASRSRPTAAWSCSRAIFAPTAPCSRWPA